MITLLYSDLDFNTISPTSMVLIATLLSVISAGIIYWRKQKDKIDEDLAEKIEEKEKENKQALTELREDQHKNQSEVLGKLDEVLKGQHTIEMKVLQAFNKSERNKENIDTLNSKVEKATEIATKDDKTLGALSEWRKRVDEKLDLK